MPKKICLICRESIKKSKTNFGVNCDICQLDLHHKCYTHKVGHFCMRDKDEIVGHFLSDYASKCIGLSDPDEINKLHREAIRKINEFTKHYTFSLLDKPTNHNLIH